MLPRRYPHRIRRTSLIGSVQHGRLYEAPSRSRGSAAGDEALLDPPVDSPAEGLLDRRVAQAEGARRLRPVVGMAVDQRPRQLTADARTPATQSADRLGPRR